MADKVTDSLANR